MICPMCGSSCIVSKEVSKSMKGLVRRLRECKGCLTEFSTEERIDYQKLDPYIRNRLHLVASSKQGH